MRYKYTLAPANDYYGHDETHCFNFQDGSPYGVTVHIPSCCLPKKEQTKKHALRLARKEYEKFFNKANSMLVPLDGKEPMVRYRVAGVLEIERN